MEAEETSDIGKVGLRICPPSGLGGHIFLYRNVVHLYIRANIGYTTIQHSTKAIFYQAIAVLA